MSRTTIEWTPPEALDEYRMVREIGQGAMGRVWLAHDTLLDRPVAVKFLVGVGPDQRTRGRFSVEARAVARVQHPNVVAVYRVGEIDGRPYLVSEFVRGRTLNALARPQPPERALAIGVALARGLAAAHRRGVLHRDIKLANAMISDDDEVKLLDFGLAKVLDRIPQGDAAWPVDPPGHPATSLAWGAEGDTLPGLASVPASRNAATGVATEPAPGRTGELEVDQRGATLTPEPPPLDSNELTPRFGATPSPAITRTGEALGTPLYMAPEIWRCLPATPQSDVYSLGVVLYELCAGHPPHQGTVVELAYATPRTDAPPLLQSAAVDPRFAAVIDRCLRRRSEERFPSGDALREALEELAAPPRATAIPEGNPYRGLAPFEAEHGGLFFGRGGEVRAILDRLRGEPCVLVAGDSGVGKSSLCRAGVLPAVADGAIADRRTWSTVRVVLGRHPIAALAAALGPLIDGNDATVAALLRSEPATVVRDLRRRQGEEKRLLLFVDQLEELCTLAEPAEAAAAAEALAAFADGASGLRLLATVRGDFLGRLGALPGLGDVVPRALHLLRPLGAARLREAIVGPALAKGVQFESEDLIDALVAPSVDAPGGLPLLQFALADLWEARDVPRRKIPRAALDAMGGVGGALARHADAVIAALSPLQRVATRRIFGRLVTAEGTRARRPASELFAAQDTAGPPALEALVRGRLLVARDGESAAGPSYEIAHEALLTAWTTLRGWLGSDEEVRALKERLERAASEWLRLGRSPPHALHPAPPTPQAWAWSPGWQACCALQHPLHVWAHGCASAPASSAPPSPPAEPPSVRRASSGPEAWSAAPPSWTPLA